MFLRSYERDEAYSSLCLFHTVHTQPGFSYIQVIIQCRHGHYDLSHAIGVSLCYLMTPDLNLCNSPFE